MKLMKKILCLVLCTIFIIPQTGCGSDEPVSENEFCLDTICTITVYDMKEKDASAAISNAFSLCRKYENMLSKTVEESDVAKLNRAQGKPVKVQDETLEVIKKGIEYGRLSKGMFDITIGAVSELWNFKDKNGTVPDKEKLEKAVDTVDYRQIRIDGNKVSLKNPQAKLDLGGIAKGYIADRVTEQMMADGVSKAVISLGGNISVIGQKAEDTPWKIGIERPYSDRSEILGKVELTDGTIATSGVYERYFKQDGVLYHHVLDPNTGYPVKNTLDAVVVKGTCGQSVDCDALGTVCLMMGEEEGRKVLEQFSGIQAAFIDQNDKMTIAGGLEILPAN